MANTDSRAPRFRVGGLHMIYDTGEEFWSGRVVDMSESGIFIETHHELPVGTKVTLMPDLPDEEQLPFEIRAELARALPHNPDEEWDRTPGLAFRLCDMASDQVEQVRAFLAAHGVVVRK